MSDERKKRRDEEELEEQAKKKKQESELGEGDNAGTFIDETGAHHFSFTGQLRDYKLLPPDADATKTDVAGLDAAPEGADEPLTPPPATQAPSSVDDDAVTDTDAPAQATKEQTEAGPVRDEDPAASSSASQSREAAGPAHSSKPTEEDESTDDPSTQTDVAAGSDVAKLVPDPTTPGGLQLPRAKRRPAPAENLDDATHTDLPEQKLTPKSTESADATRTDLPEQKLTPKPADPADATRTDLPEQKLTPKPADPADATRTDLPEQKLAPKPADPADATRTDLPEQKFTPKPDDRADATRTQAPLEAAPGPDDATRTQPDPQATTDDFQGPAADPDGVTQTQPGPAQADAARQPEADQTHAYPAIGPEESTWTQDEAPDASAPAEEPQAEAPEAYGPDADTASVEVPPQTRTDQGSLDAPLSVPAEPTFTGAPLFDVPAPPVVEEEVAESVERRSSAPRRRRGVRRPRPTLRRFLKDFVDAYHPADLARRAGAAVVRRLNAWSASAKQVHAQRKLSHTAEWWRRTLTEIGVLYAIIVPIESAVGHLGSFGVHPHPYWLIVLPMAAARGVVAGMITATIALGLYAVGAMRAIEGTDLFTYGNMLEPILFYAVAFFTGELRDEMELKKRKLERRLDDVNERSTRLRQERDVLSDANRELEKRIVDDSAQFGNLIAAAERIEKSGKHAVYELALEMVEEHCGAASSVLMLLEDGSLDYLAHRGWADDELGDRLEAARQSDFVERAVAGGVAVNGFRPEETPPATGPLVVAPLFDAGGVVKALLCLDHVPVSRLNEATITLFLGISEWVSAALARLVRTTAAPAALPVGQERGAFLGSPEELGKRLRLELARCSRYGVPTSFLTIQATEWKDSTPEGIEMVDRYVLSSFTSGLRPSDALYRFGYPGCYLLMLAGTTVQGAEVVRTRLMRRIEYSTSLPVGMIDIAATGPDVEAPDLISLADRVSDRFRRFSSLPLEGRCPIDVPDQVEVGDVTAFMRRLRLETSLAVRNGFDLYVAGISADRRESVQTGLLARHVLQAGSQTLRPTDGVYTIGPYHCAIILPCTNGEEAATVIHRVATLVRSRDPNAPYGALETQVLGLGPTHPDAASFLSALARRTPAGGQA
jgi:hypothetical protein